MIGVREMGRRVSRCLKGILRPRDLSRIQDWGRKNIILSSQESGDFPGPYDPDVNPIPTILFEAYQSGKYKKLVFKKSSQSGVTLAVLVLMCWFVTNIVRNILYVIDTRDEARDISSLRFQPMIAACRAARKLGRLISEEMTNMACEFAGCIAYFRGSNSVGGLSNKSVGLAIYDETDAYPVKKSAKERATELGKERGKRQTNFVEILLSKPQDWDDTINHEYLLGSRHKCFCPCPHCGTMQVIEWEQIKFKHLESDDGSWRFEDFEDEVYFECISQDCRDSESEGKIYESAKSGMIAEGARDWRQTNFGEDGIGPLPEVFSCEITDLTSTFPGITWAAIAQEFVEALGDPSKLQNFFRGRLARATKRKKIEIATGDIYRMCGKYKRGHIPEECDVILMASDVQQRPPFKKWMTAGFRLEDDACFVSDYGEFLTFDELLKEANVPTVVDKWNRFTPAAKRIDPVVRNGLIDERFEPGAVRDFITSTFMGYDDNGLPMYRFYSCRGWGGMHTRKMRDVVTPVSGQPPNASHKGHALWAYDLSDDHFKDLLYNNRIARFKERLAAIENGEAPPADVPLTMFPALLDPEFVAELCQERYVWNPIARRFEWEEPKGPNDWGDALKYLLVQWYLVKPVVAMERALAMSAAA